MSKESVSYTLRSKKLLKCSLIVIGVRLTEMQVYFTVNVGRKFWDFSIVENDQDSLIQCSLYIRKRHQVNRE